MKNITSLCFILLLCAPNFVAQTPAPTPATTLGSAENLLVSPQPSSAPLKETPASVIKPNAEQPGSPYARKDAPARIPHFDTAPVIDGQLNDAVWRSAARFGDFVQTSPGDNVAPTYPTEFMMGYDAKNLYMAFRVTQDRSTVRATVARRDNIFNDDYVLVHLDTFNDQRQAYLLFFSPLGIQADGTFTEGRGEDYSLDIVMESKGVLTEDGYTIEVAIPFKSLRYEAGKDKLWGLHINRRVKYKNNEYNSWMPTNRSISGWLNQAGHITGLEGIETTRQLEINPSLTLSESGRRTRFTFDGDPSGRFVNEGVKGEFGATAKFSLTPTTTLDFAYNPDFAQVEADAPVTTANQRFPIFFPEKRPFFLERIDIFQSGLNIVNTRAIIDPDVAVKLTGRRGRNTFGLLYASDNAPGNYSKDERQSLLECQQQRLADLGIVCGVERFVDKNAHIGILRIKRDIGSQHNLGLFATSYNFIERHNNTAGFDGRFRLDPKTVTEFQVVGTTSRRNFYDPDLDRALYRTGNGFGYRAYLERADRNLYMNYLAIGRTRDYRADVGFTQRFDTNYLGSYIRYETDRDRKKSIIYKRLQNATNISYDWSGRSQYSITDTAGMLALQRQTFVQLAVQFGYERVFEHEFGANRTANRQGAFFGPSAERSAHFKAVNGFIETTPNKQFYAFVLIDYTMGQMEYDFGNGPDYPRVSRAALLDPNNGFDPGGGNQLTIESSFRYQPTTAFQTQLNYNKRRLVRHDTGLVAFDDNIFSSRSTYQFSRNTFARLRLDYSTLNKHLRPQFVLGWTPNPGTALYIGYNDDVSYNGYNQFTGQFEPGFRGNGRAFFIKASYLFRRSF
ncbi:MAG TPA: carbohydrate binding family 9 domain-containing protein [Pyrinomonadaceae bacterium]|jgi:hypothetical protein